jgi:branched-chain amino acid transport system substrate-binding protein
MSAAEHGGIWERPQWTFPWHRLPESSAKYHRGRHLSVTDMSNQDPERQSLSRRRLLQGLGMVGLGAVGAPAILAACGSSSKSSSTSTTAGGGAATTGAPVGNALDVTKLRDALKIGTNASGKGMPFSLASVLAITGTGSFYGSTMKRGTDLAVDHIKAAGGPDIKVDYYDHKSGDPQAGVDAITQIGAKKTPAKLASYGDDIAAMTPGTIQYKVFTLDGGGGTGIFNQGKPFFWGTRAITPNDTLPGLFQYIKAKLPNAKTIGATGWDVGAELNDVTKKDVLAKIDAGGLKFNNLYELVPIGKLDYASLFPKIKANEPDVLLVGMYGQDPGAFLDQSQTAGIKAKIFGFEFTPDGVKASNGAYDQVGWSFTYDYFDPDTAPSPLARLFVTDFKKKYGENPDFYAANFYENTLAMWQIISRVLAKGGNINSGDDLDKALQDNLTLFSVYGGDANTIGTTSLDPTTHSVKERQMGVFQYKNKKVTPLAFFGIGGKDFKLI